MLIQGEQIQNLNKKSRKQKFPKFMDTYQVRKFNLISDSYKWEVRKVIPCHFIHKTEVPRYFRILISPIPGSYVDGPPPSAKQSAYMALRAFAIDVAEQDYVSMFGEFKEEN